MDEPIPSIASTHALTDLVRAAERAVEEGVTTNDFEPAFAALMEHILGDAACHDAARAIFIEGVRGSMSWEMLSYLMHGLRWDEVRRAAIARIHEAEDWRVKNPLAHIVAAFNDDWEDAEMYQRWQ